MCEPHPEGYGSFFCSGNLNFCLFYGIPVTEHDDLY